MPGPVLNISCTLSHCPVKSYPHFIDRETKGQAGHTADRGAHPCLADSGVPAFMPEREAWQGQNGGAAGAPSAKGP